MTNKARLFVTGECGFVGRHIVRLKDRIENEFGLSLVTPASQYDILSPASLDRVLAEVIPDFVIHLAGMSFIPDAINNPRAALEVNFLGTLNLLESLKKSRFEGTFLYVSSGDVYGRLGLEQLPVTEMQMPKPLNPYAVSKVASEALCYQWGQTSKFRVIIARPFNHIGIWQREDFVISAMAKQIAEIKLNRRAPEIFVGDIDVSRDFLDVEDVIRGYMYLLKSGSNVEIYNVCSGKDFIIRDLINEMMNVAEVHADLIQDQTRLRQSEQRKVIGSNVKLMNATSWYPIVPMSRSLANVLTERLTANI